MTQQTSSTPEPPTPNQPLLPSTPLPLSGQTSPTTHPLSSGQDSSLTPPISLGKRSASVPYARFMLCLILIISFVVFLRNSDVLQIIGLIATLMSVNLLEPIYKSVDRLDKLFAKLEEPMRKFFLCLGKHSFRLISLLLAFTIIILIFHSALGMLAYQANDAFCLRTSLAIPAALCNSGLGVTHLPDGERLGLVSLTNQNDAPFDSSGKTNSDETQVEKLIFAEDGHACVSTQSHVTLAVVTMLSRTVDDPRGSASIGLDDLQGAYLAQHDYNGSQPPIRLCLVIANIGTLTISTQGGDGETPVALTQVIQQLVQYARYNSTFRGIIGFPYSSQVKEALTTLATSWQDTTLPIVSPESTGIDLSHTLNYPNLHRVSSPDPIQASAMAQYVCHPLVSPPPSVRIALFSDPADIYSAGLSTSFQATLQACLGDRGTYDLEYYQSGNTQLIQQAVADAVQNKQDQFIFFPGHVAEVDALEGEIQRLQINSTWRVTLLAGDGLYDITNPGYNFFAPLYTTVYASPLDMRDPQSKLVYTEYDSSQFQLPYPAAALESYGPYELLPQDVLRAYEATQAFTQTMVQDGQNASLPSQALFNRILSNIHFTSFGNLITFQGQVTNDPLPLPVDIMCINSAHRVYWVATYNSQDGQFTMRQKASCS